MPFINDIRSEPSGDQTENNRNLAERSGTSPAPIINNLQARLNAGAAQQAASAPQGGEFRKMHKGGVVKATGPVILKKGEIVLPAPQDAQNPPTQDDSDSMSDDTAVSGESINLQRAYSRLNEAVRAMLDGLGIRRSATIPHQKSQSMVDHLNDVGQALSTKGNISGNILTATHTIHDKDGGSTVAHPNQQLQETIIPKDSVEAKAAINACKSFISKCESLVGETPEIQKAKAQISIIGKSDMAGMSAFDGAAALLNVPGPVIAALARAHNFVKHGEHKIHLTGPKQF
jgi:hypothetical protein